MPSANPSNTILAEIGWDDGLSIPVANAENKKLETQYLERQKEAGNARSNLVEVEDKVNDLNNHMKNVRQELQATQALLRARKKEHETEEHMVKINEREYGRIRQEISKLEKEFEELKDRRNFHENLVFKQTQKLEDQKNQMNWDQQALEAWLEECHQKDDNSMIIAKYSRQDEAKIKELALKISNLTEECHAKKRKLDLEHIETQTTQVSLDKTAEEFRKAHLERQELITRWEQTIEQMQHRDNEMDILALELAKIKSVVREKENLSKEKEEFYLSEVNNNAQLDKKISMADRIYSKARQEFEDMEKQKDMLNNEMEALKRTAARTAADLEATRSEVTQLKKEITSKTEKFEIMKKRVEETREALKKSLDSVLTAEERSKRLNEIMQQEEKAQIKLEEELKKLRQLHFKKSQAVKDLTVQKKALEIEIQNARVAIRNLNQKISKLDQETLQKLEILYKKDFEIQMAEKKLNLLKGNVSTALQDELQVKVKEATLSLEEKTKSHNLLLAQNKQLQDDIRRVKNHLELNSSQNSNLSKKIGELELHLEIANKQLKKTVNDKQDRMVYESMKKLEIKRMRDALYKKADEVLSLEKHQLQLKTAMEERHHEIEIHKEMLATQLRTADDEKRQISAELHGRISKIDKLKKRYEILTMAMAPPDGEEERSMSYYIIKAAQEKEELQREGNELDAKIRTAEQEIKALENTLRVLSGKNEQCRKTFSKVSESGSEMEEKYVLEEQLRTVMDRFRYKKNKMRDHQQDIMRMNTTLEHLIRDEEAYSDSINEKQSICSRLSKDADDQQTKLDRVTKMNMKVLKEIHSMKKVKEADEERDIEVRELRELNQQATKQIVEIVHKSPEVAPAVQHYFEQANMPIPASGAASSMSSRSSTSSLLSIRSGQRTSASSASTRVSTPKAVASPVFISIEEMTIGKTGSRPSSAASSSRSKKT